MSTNLNLALGTVTCTAASISGSASLGGTLTTAGLLVPRLPYVCLSGTAGAQSLPSGSVVISGLGNSSGDTTLASGWNAGVFTAPYNGLFCLNASIRTSASAVYWSPSWFSVPGVDGLSENATSNSVAIILQAAITIQMLQGQTMTLLVYNGNSGWSYSGGLVLVQLLARTT